MKESVKWNLNLLTKKLSSSLGIETYNLFYIKETLLFNLTLQT